MGQLFANRRTAGAGRLPVFLGTRRRVSSLSSSPVVSVTHGSSSAAGGLSRESIGRWGLRWCLRQQVWGRRVPPRHREAARRRVPIAIGLAPSLIGTDGLIRSAPAAFGRAASAPSAWACRGGRGGKEAGGRGGGHDRDQQVARGRGKRIWQTPVLDDEVNGEELRLVRSGEGVGERKGREGPFRGGEKVCPTCPDPWPEQDIGSR